MILISSFVDHGLLKYYTSSPQYRDATTCQT